MKTGTILLSVLLLVGCRSPVDLDFTDSYDHNVQIIETIVPQGTELKSAKVKMRKHGFSWRYDKGIDIPISKGEVRIGSTGPLNLATCERTIGNRQWMVIIEFVDGLSSYVHVQSETDEIEEAEH